jgi:hypothetical protein
VGGVPELWRLAMKKTMVSFGRYPPFTDIQRVEWLAKQL